jgi:enoyl-[acyl-carrier protein] reductase I
MLSIDLRGKKAFVAGVGDDKGFGWAIAKALHRAGASVLIGVWPPVLNIFRMSLEGEKFDESRKHPDGSRLEFLGIYPFDALYDKPSDVPQEVLENKRYKGLDGFTISEVAERIDKEHGPIDILVHSLANAPEVQKPLLETSRAGYLSAVSSSTYSFVSMLAHFCPKMNKGGSALNLTYIASEKVIPGYGGGMSSAKAALESDTRVLAFEAGIKYALRVNSISAGPYASRAAKAIGFIEKMIEYTSKAAPLQRAIEAEDVANAAAFLASDLSSAITGEVIHVDCGMHIMGAAPSVLF